MTPEESKKRVKELRQEMFHVEDLSKSIRREFNKKYIDDVAISHKVDKIKQTLDLVVAFVGKHSNNINFRTISNLRDASGLQKRATRNAKKLLWG